MYYYDLLKRMGAYEGSENRRGPILTSNSATWFFFSSHTLRIIIWIDILRKWKIIHRLYCKKHHWRNDKGTIGDSSPYKSNNILGKFKILFIIKDLKIKKKIMVETSILSLFKSLIWSVKFPDETQKVIGLWSLVFLKMIHSLYTLLSVIALLG